MAEEAASIQDAEQMQITHISLEQLGVETPKIPGDVSISGCVPRRSLRSLFPTYKAWLFIGEEDIPHWRDAEEELERYGAEGAGGIQVARSYWPKQPSDEQADAALAQIDLLPRPLMIQCRTGGRASAALTYWMARRRGYSLASLQQLAADDNVFVFERCTQCGPMRDFIKERVPESSAGQEGAGAAPAGDGLIFRQLFDATSSTYTYLLGCARSRQCVLIDPVLEQVDRDLSVVEELGLSLARVVNTHCHADHVTGGGRIRERLAAAGEAGEFKTCISAASACKCDVALREGDTVVFGHEGSLFLEALATPGHTNGCLSFLLRRGGDSNYDRVFTGDTVLIRGCGRTDFQEGSSDRLYESVHEKIFTLAGETLIFPGHDYKGRTVSTVAEEKEFNPRLTKGKEEFIKIMSELSLPYPKKMDVAVPANMACGV